MPGGWLIVAIWLLMSPSVIWTVITPGALKGVLTVPVKLGSVKVSVWLPWLTSFCQTT